jgi:nucleoside-diphosphate-sugar epimerase
MIQKKVIVTGGTGFIGRHLVPKLLKLNYQVIIFGRDPLTAKIFPWIDHVEFIKYDLTDQEIPDISMQDMGLIHLAWPGLPNYEKDFHENKNLPDSLSFIEQCLAAGLKQVLVSGTCFEYGMKEGKSLSSDATNPANPYARAKDQLRLSLLNFQKKYDFSLQWARLFYMYGLGQNSNSIIAQLDQAAKNNEKFFNMSGGAQLRDYLPVSQAADQLLNLYMHYPDGTYNICSGKPISIEQLVKNRIQEKKLKIDLNLGFYSYSDLEPMNFWGERDIY